MTRQGRILLALSLVVAAVAAAAAAAQVLKLRIRIHDLELLPIRSEVLEADAAIRDTFGSDERLLIAFVSRRRPVTDPVFVEDLRFFTRELGRSHNIRMLLLDRLTHARFSRGPVPGEPYFLHPPGAEWIAAALRSSTIVRKLATGASRRTVFLETPAVSGTGVETIVVRARAALAALDRRRPGEYEVRFLGRHVVLNGLGKAVLEDLQRLLPWCFAVIFLLFWGMFRSPWLAGIAIVQSGLCVLFTMAILQIRGHPVSLTTAMIPVLITVLGIADEIHLFSHYLELRRRFPESPTLALAGQAVGRVFFPCTATALTTVIGFAAFLPTEVPALQVFGLVAGLGICISWLLTLTLIPVWLAFVPLPPVPASPGLRLRRALPPRLVRALPLVLSIALIPGVLRLQIDDGWTRNFRPDHPIVQDVRWFERESIGLYYFDVMLTSRDDRAWTEPDRLRALERLQTEVEAAPEVTAAFSLADLVRDRGWELGDPAAERPPLPASRREAESLLATYRIFNQEVFRRTFLDRDGRSTRLLFAMAGDGYGVSTRARRTLEARVRQIFDPRLVAARIGGSAERGRVLIESVVRSQAIAVLASLVLSGLTLGIASGRWGLSLRCLLAISWALLLVLGVAGWLGLPLGVASSCFLALGIGVGLDYGIHLAFGHGQAADSEDAASTPARRILANVVIVGAGLSVLTFSTNPTIARLGLLVVLSMIASSGTAIVLFGRSSQT